MQKNKIACLTIAALLAVNVAGMAPAHTSAESLWGSHHSLFSDRKASQVGDILTILINESSKTACLIPIPNPVINLWLLEQEFLAFW